MILGTSFGVAMQYLMDPQRQDVLECFDVLHAAVEREDWTT
jgi:hypothetical protein